MADQNEAKTKTIGYLPIEKAQALKGWDEYLDKSTQLSVLRTEAQKAKNAVRDALKERLNDYGDIDFVGEGDRIRVFRVFRKQQARRTRSLDLSASFREQPLDGHAETNSHDAGACEESNDATPNPSPPDGTGRPGPCHGASHGHHAGEGAKVAPSGVDPGQCNKRSPDERSDIRDGSPDLSVQAPRISLRSSGLRLLRTAHVSDK